MNTTKSLHSNHINNISLYPTFQKWDPEVKYHQYICTPLITLENYEHIIKFIFTKIGVPIAFKKDVSIHTYWLLEGIVCEGILDIHTNKSQQVLLEYRSGYHRSLVLHKIVKYYLEYFNIIPSNIDKTQQMKSVSKLSSQKQPSLFAPDMVTICKILNAMVTPSWEPDSIISYTSICTLSSLIKNTLYHTIFIQIPGAVQKIFDLLPFSLDLEKDIKGNTIPMQQRHMQSGMLWAFHQDTGARALTIILDLIKSNDDDVCAMVLAYMSYDIIILIENMILITDEFIPFLAREANELLTYFTCAK